MSGNVVLDKTYKFSIKIILLCKKLNSESKEYILSKQLLRAGTSIGANAEEAIGGISKKDFVAKLGISYKEARETHYWLRLLRDTNIVSKEEANLLLNDCDEILRIIYSIIKSSRNNM